MLAKVPQLSGLSSSLSMCEDLSIWTACPEEKGMRGYEPTSNPSISTVPNGLNPTSTFPGGPNRFHIVFAKVLADDAFENSI